MDMESFCGSKLWDLNVTWYTDTPDFTPCFEKTVLVWVPCGFLWFFAGFELAHAFNRERRSREPSSNSSRLHESICFFTFFLIVVNFARWVYTFLSLFRPISADVRNRIYPVDHVAPAIKFSTYALVFYLRRINNSKGVPYSGILFLFWLLSATGEFFEFQTNMRSLPFDEGNDQQLVAFVVLLVSFPVQVLLVVLSAFNDAQITRSYLTRDSENKPCPESSASLPSILTFSWVWSLVHLGYKKPLEAADLWLLDEDNAAANVLDKFYQAWLPEFQKCKEHNKILQLNATSSNDDENIHEGDDQVLITASSRAENQTKSKKIASILPAIWKVHWKPYCFGSILLFVSNLVMFISPQILNLLIEHVSSDEEIWKGYLYAAIMFLSANIHILLSEHQFIFMQKIGMRTQSALTSAVYRKSLIISNAARKESTTGEIANLMSIDAERFNDLLMYFNQGVWSAPMEIALSLYFLYALLGPSIFAGLGVLVLLLPITSIIWHVREKLQEQQMENKDQRVKIVNEVLAGIKVLKFYAWEPSFETEIQKIRQKELRVMKKEVYIDSFSDFVWYTAPFLVFKVLFRINQVTLVTFATYVLSDTSHILDARKAFVALTLFNLMRFPMSVLPWCLTLLIQTKVSLDRLNKFLNAEEIDPEAVGHMDTIDGTAVRVEVGTFGWNEETPILNNINVRVDKGSLVAVVGVVGAGKSSLLSAVLGEMEKKSGSVNITGSIAYVSQQAWIQNDTLRGNILFGSVFDAERYEKVIKACALQPDLDILPAGDKTEIGEKGINLSGGQKQRVALARAVYNGADIYLMDDPLSAVDSHVAKHLFDQVVGPHGMLRRKTRIIVTHGLKYLPHVDCIVVMKAGEISEIGTFKELLAKKGAFADVLTEYLKPEDFDQDDSAFIQLEAFQGLREKVVKRQRMLSQVSEGDVKSPTTPTSQKQFPGLETGTTEEKPSPSTADRLIEEEKAEVGTVDKKVYLHYMKNVGWGFVVFTLIFHVLLHGFTLGSNLWLAKWSMEPAVNGTENIPKRNFYLSVYGGIGLFQAVSVFVAALSIALGSLHASKMLHNQMLNRILHSPMSFFDTTPIGRIVNRFSKDIDVADGEFPWNLRAWLNCLFEVIVTLIAISYSTPWIVVVFIPILILYYVIQRFYVASSRQLKRLESVSRSPIFSHFSETLTGTSTVRAFGVQYQFIENFYRKLDTNIMAFYPKIIANRWLAVCLECLGNIVTFCAALLAVTTRPSPGIVGLSLTYALNMVDAFNWLVRQVSSVETDAVAIERLKEYSEIEQEAKWDIPYRKPPSGWPQHGRICFRKYQTRYREGLDLVLKDITCIINPGEKVGIVGRTGAGKSSMTLSLFRIIEATGGSIEIDDVDISKLGLHDVRGCLTIIPQDPVLFAGSLRMNLDPFSRYSDTEVWRALEFAHLKDTVLEFTEGLLHAVNEGGDNLSVGQRQLVCLARALLRKSKILILDEATAAVDLETDDLIQQTIRREFADCTVLTIAHRLNTIMDYNKVMVLDNGEIREFDEPNVLLSNSASIFHGMAKSAGIV